MRKGLFPVALLLALFTRPACYAQQVKLTWHDITTSISGSPAGSGYMWIHYDQVSRQMWFFSPINGSTSIYGSDTYFFNASNNAFTHLGGNGSTDNNAACAQSDGPTWPKDRHPSFSLVDTKRNILVLFSGVCQGVFPNPAYMWRLALNSDPTTDAWSRGSAPSTVPNQANNQSGVYDDVNDIYFWYGYDGGAGDHNTFMYCPLLGNPGGTLTSKQVSAGCTRGDDWIELSSSGQPSSSGLVSPRLISYKGYEYMFGGQAPFEIWRYSVVTQMFEERCMSCSVPADSDAQPNFAAAAYVGRGYVVIHEVSGASAPSDYSYNMDSDVLNPAASTGTGPVAVGTANYAMDMDASTNQVVLWSMASTVAMFTADVVLPPIGNSLGGGGSAGASSRN